MTAEAERIISQLAEHRHALEAFGVRRIGLFGSAARREPHATSDLDFLVELKAKSFDAFMDLKFFLEDLFQRRVDLVLADALKPRLRPAILAEGVYAEGFEGLS